MKVKINKLSPDAIIPKKATPGSSCYDIYSPDGFVVLPLERKLVSSGLAFELPERFGMEIRPRSGLASQGLIILNSPGTLDNDYRGELKISFMDLSEDIITVHRGDRIAQIRLFEEIDIEFEEGELNGTERGEGGFGSTGK